VDDDCQDACATGVFSFLDTGGNDIANNALRNFFQSLVTDPNEFLLFEIVETTGTRGICSANAEFYRASYLSLRDPGGTVNSGSWDKWHRSPATSDAWTGPDAGSYANRFGSDCTQKDSWCPEDSLGGLRIAVDPREGNNTCEAQDFDEPGFCGDGTWQLTIRIAPTRLVACGF
jgi:hypothetical protein